MKKREKNNGRIRVRKRWNGFHRYLYKIIISNMLLILIPICFLGIVWFSMISHQAEKKFHQQKSIELNEIVSGIKQRVKTLKFEIAIEAREQKYSTYTFSDEYNSDLSKLSNRLSSMIEKYHLLHSVYFYDRTTGKIYNSKSGKYEFRSFYDTSWLKDTKDIYSVQQLPLRYTFEDQALLEKYSSIYSEYNQLVLSLAIKGRPDFYLLANVSIKKLFNDIADSYDLNTDHLEFFFLATDGKLIEGKCDYSRPESLLKAKSKYTEGGVSYIIMNNRIYFKRSLDFGLFCITSYPLYKSYQESQYLGKYIVLICMSLLLFLFAISCYMAKRLYQPIDTLYCDIAESTKNLQSENVSNEIDMLKQVFLDMNTFNSNAKLKLMQFDEISKAFSFRSFLENSRGREDFIQDHPYLFDENGNCFCEMLLLKYYIMEDGMSVNDEMLFRLNLQEVLRTYLQSSMKGILTKVEDDNLVLLYLGKDTMSLEQTRKIVTDTVIKLTKGNAYFAVSQPIRRIDEVLCQYRVCLDLINTSYFFGWTNEVIAPNQAEKVKDLDALFNMLLNINTSFIRSIVTHNEAELANLVKQLDTQLREIKDSSQVREVCNRILVDLDHEFHFNKFIESNLLQVLHENKTLNQMMQYLSRLLKQISYQYGSNDVKENNYCELAKKYLKDHYMKDMNITDAADHLDISYSYLSKIFRARIGMTLTDYLNNIRIEKSKEYLSDTFLTLGEISEKIGYNNAQSYQRFFKKYVNITPGDYRKLHANKRSFEI